MGKNSLMNKLTCPCCGFKTLDTEHYGSYTLCPVCFWEDDEVQIRNPTWGGANLPLIDAQKNFIAFGACDEHGKKFVRSPLPDETKDELWKPFN